MQKATSEQVLALRDRLIVELEKLHLDEKDVAKLLSNAELLKEWLSRVVANAIEQDSPHNHDIWWQLRAQSEMEEREKRRGALPQPAIKALESILNDVLRESSIPRDWRCRMGIGELVNRVQRVVIESGEFDGTRKVMPVEIPASEYTGHKVRIVPDESMGIFAGTVKPPALPLKLHVYAVVETSSHYSLCSRFGEQAEVGLEEMFEVVRRGTLNYDNFPYFVLSYKTFNGELYAVKWLRALKAEWGECNVKAHHVTPEDPGEWSSGWWIVTH